MLIDGGSTYNFIDQSVVTKLRLQVVRGKTLRWQSTINKLLSAPDVVWGSLYQFKESQYELIFLFFQWLPVKQF